MSDWTSIYISFIIQLEIYYAVSAGLQCIYLQTYNSPKTKPKSLTRKIQNPTTLYKIEVRTKPQWNVIFRRHRGRWCFLPVDARAACKKQILKIYISLFGKLPTKPQQTNEIKCQQSNQRRIFNCASNTWLSKNGYRKIGVCLAMIWSNFLIATYDVVTMINITISVPSDISA